MEPGFKTGWNWCRKTAKSANATAVEANNNSKKGKVPERRKIKEIDLPTWNFQPWFVTSYTCVGDHTRCGGFPSPSSFFPSLVIHVFPFPRLLNLSTSISLPIKPKCFLWGFRQSPTINVKFKCLREVRPYTCTIKISHKCWKGGRGSNTDCPKLEVTFQCTESQTGSAYVLQLLTQRILSRLYYVMQRSFWLGLLAVICNT